jgi:hypothetical protein
MKTKTIGLTERRGVLYLQGVAITPRSYVKIDGVSWKVVGTGRSPGKSQALFLWVKHEQYGTTVFVPGLELLHPYRAPRPAEQEFVPKLSYAKSYRHSQPSETLPLMPEYPQIAEKGKPHVAPQEWDEFKDALLQESKQNSTRPVALP